MTSYTHNIYKLSDNLLELVSVLLVTETMDRGCAIDIFYFDLEKAFNTIPHEQLVAKLKTACRDCRIINWIIDYLSGKNNV